MVLGGVVRQSQLRDGDRDAAELAVGVVAQGTQGGGKRRRRSGAEEGAAELLLEAASAAAGLPRSSRAQAARVRAEPRARADIVRRHRLQRLEQIGRVLIHGSAALGRK